MRTKLIQIGVYGDRLEEVIAELIEENYLNEERFARSFARGKFRIKKWGRNKIVQELQLKQVSEYCIRKAMEEIEDEDYEQSLVDVLRSYNMKLGDIELPIKVKKLTAHGIKKGYEMEKVIEEVRRIVF